MYQKVNTLYFIKILLSHINTSVQIRKEKKKEAEKYFFIRQKFILFYSVFYLLSSYQRSELQALDIRLNDRKCPLLSPYHLRR